MSFLPHGSPYADVFRKDRAHPRELIRQITGVAYACAHLNADGVASTRLRLFVRTAAREPATRWPARPVAAKTAAQLARTRDGAAFAAGGATIEELIRPPPAPPARPAADRRLQRHRRRARSLRRRRSRRRRRGRRIFDGQPALSGHDLLYLTQLYLESLGRAYWLLDRDALGVPRRVRLLRSHLVREVPDPTGRRRHRRLRIRRLLRPRRLPLRPPRRAPLQQPRPRRPLPRRVLAADGGHRENPHRPQGRRPRQRPAGQHGPPRRRLVAQGRQRGRRHRRSRGPPGPLRHARGIHPRRPRRPARQRIPRLPPGPRLEARRRGRAGAGQDPSRPTSPTPSACPTPCST